MMAPALLWPAVWKLLKLRGIIFFSGFRRARLRRKIGIAVLSLMFAGFLGFIFFLSWTLLGFLRSPELVQYAGDITPILESMPTLIIGGAFLGILVTSFGVLLQALYLAGDMEFLLSAPVPIRAVFITKLLQAILPNFGLICAFSLPVLYGLGASAGYNPLYYPFVLVALVAFVLAAAGISSLLVMGVVRVFPARRVAEVLGFLGAVISFICSQLGQVARFGGFNPDQGAAVVQGLERFNSPWSPLAWVGRGLVALGEGHWAAGAGFLIPGLGLAIIVFGLALSGAERLYYSGWARMQNVRRRVKAAPAQRPAGRYEAFSNAARRIPSPIRAILVKDALVLRRDLRNMSQLVTPLILGVVYAIMFLRSGGNPPPGRGEAPAWFMETLGNLMIYGNVGISLFVGWMLVARLGGMGFSQEGKSYWLIKTAPVGVGQLMAAKFGVVYLPSLALGWAFLVGITLLQRLAASTLLFTLPVVALCVAGNSGLNLAFGALGANLDWDDPRHMQKGSSGCFGSLAGVLYLVVSLAFFFAPPVIFVILGWSRPAGQLAGLLLGGGLSLACALVPLRLVYRHVASLGEG